VAGALSGPARPCFQCVSGRSLLLAVDGERDRVALGEEADRLLDLRALGPRRDVGPRDVLVLGAAHVAVK
jgi:hypothetical protein